MNECLNIPHVRSIHWRSYVLSRKMSYVLLTRKSGKMGALGGHDGSASEESGGDRHERVDFALRDYLFPVYAANSLHSY